jgi:flagellar protein FlaG
VSEISITRFQPALVAREKVNSVQAVDSDTDLEHTHNPLQNKDQDQEQQKQKGAGKQSSSRKKPVPLKNNNYEQMAAESETEIIDSDPDDDSMEHIISRLNDYVQSVKRDIIFDFDPASGEPSVTVVDRESRKVLRQFDSKEAQELARKLDKKEPISLFQTQV